MGFVKDDNDSSHQYTDKQPDNHSREIVNHKITGIFVCGISDRQQGRQGEQHKKNKETPDFSVKELWSDKLKQQDDDNDYPAEHTQLPDDLFDVHKPQSLGNLLMRE